MEIIITILVIICGCQFYFCRKYKNQYELKKLSILAYNEETRIENAKLEEQNDYLKQEQNDLTIKRDSIQLEIDNLNKIINDKTSSLTAIDNTIKSMQASAANIAKQKADLEYANYKSDLETEYQSVIQELSTTASLLVKEINWHREQLSALESKQNAYIEEQKRKELIAAQADYYRLNLSESDIRDIEALRQIQSVISHKEAIDKVIWDIYYKPAYDTLASHLFDKNERICGIYKITCLTTDKAYIGQSVDVKERFRQHIKSALSHTTTSNKLYQEMKKYNPYDFTFELLEQVPRTELNERETYWISFYKTNDYGLNSTRGGA